MYLFDYKITQMIGI